MITVYTVSMLNRNETHQNEHLTHNLKHSKWKKRRNFSKCWHQKDTLAIKMNFFINKIRKARKQRLQFWFLNYINVNGKMYVRCFEWHLIDNKWFINESKMDNLLLFFRREFYSDKNQIDNDNCCSF